ncbi:MAG: putative phosphoesterase [Haloarculaceae archaeon]|jgi:putative phosphoesterase
MLVALADTHAETDLPLTDNLRETLGAADVVCHAGDFTTGAVLDAFEAATDRLVAVHGNSDGMAVRERLPAVATVEALGRKFLVVHGHEHDRTSLPLLARQEGADVVVVGHTHQPGVENIGETVLVNPGSHADPRGSQPAYATFEGDRSDVRGRLRTPDGDPFSTFGVYTGRRKP